MHIALVSCALRPGVTEDAMLAASERFQREFADAQDGILKRVVVRDGDGGYADLVFFTEPAAMERVMAAEQDSEVCASLMSMLEVTGEPRMFEVLQAFE